MPKNLRRAIAGALGLALAVSAANADSIAVAVGAEQNQIDAAKTIKDSFETVIWPLIDALPVA